MNLFFYAINHYVFVLYYSDYYLSLLNRDDSSCKWVIAEWPAQKTVIDKKEKTQLFLIIFQIFNYKLNQN